MKKAYSLIWNILSVLVGVIFFIPIYFLIINSFKALPEVISQPLSLPIHLTFENYIRVLKGTNFLRIFWNSIIVTSISLFGIVFFGSLAAFKISKMRYGGIFVFYFLLTLIIPFQALMIPTVKLLKDLSLVDSLFGLILVYTGNGLALSIFMYFSSLKNIPASLEESARIDGAGDFTIFYRIILPLLLPATKTVVILNGLWIWNDFLLPLIVIISDSKKTLPLGTINLIIGQYSFSPQLAATVSMLSGLPIVIVYVLFQRKVIEGIVEGAIRG